MQPFKFNLLNEGIVFQPQSNKLKFIQTKQQP